MSYSLYCSAYKTSCFCYPLRLQNIFISLYISTTLEALSPVYSTSSEAKKGHASLNNWPKFSKFVLELRKTHKSQTLKAGSCHLTAHPIL